MPAEHSYIWLLSHPRLTNHGPIVWTSHDHTYLHHHLLPSHTELVEAQDCPPARTINILFEQSEYVWLIPLHCVASKSKNWYQEWGSAQYLCQLQIGTSIGACHLPLQGLNHVLLRLLIFNIPWKEFGVHSRNETFSVPGKTGRTGLQIVIFKSQFYEPNSCISSYLEKQENPSQWWLFLVTSRKLLQKNMCLIAGTLLSPKLHIYWHSSLPLWSSFSELPEVLSPRL